MTLLTRQIRFTAIARREFEDAAHWYEGKRKGLGAQFILVVEAKLDSIRKTPEMFPMTYRYSRVVIKRFPYAIFFEVLGQNIHVLAIFHTSREPKSFDDRL